MLSLLKIIKRDLFNYKYPLLIIVVNLLLFLIIISTLLFFANKISYSVNDFLRDERDIIQLSINDYKIENIFKLAKGNAVITIPIDFNKNKMIINIDNTSIEIDSRKGLAMHFSDDFDPILSNDSFRKKLTIEGRIWNASDNTLINNYYSIWLNTNLGEILNLNIGDIFTIQSDKPISVIIEGFFSTDSPFYDIIMPIELYKNIYKENVNVNIFLSGIENIYNYIDFLNKENIFFNDDMDLNKSFVEIKNIIYIFYFLSVMIIFLSAINFTNNIYHFLYHRRKFIGLLKALGYDNNSIITVYGLISELLLFLSFIISIPLSYLLNAIIINVIFNNITYKIDNDFLIIPLLMVWILLNVITLILMILKRKKINIISSINLMKEV